MSELGKYVTDKHGAVLVFHTHADSHVGTQEEIERFLDGTDPETVQLCLDTGHVAYCGADNLKLIADYPDRVQYVHLKQVDPAIQARVREEKLGFAPAVRLGAMVEPPLGEPDMVTLLAALGALDRDLYCIVEQDMYPCDFDKPLPDRRPHPAVLQDLRPDRRPAAGLIRDRPRSGVPPAPAHQEGPAP